MSGTERTVRVASGQGFWGDDLEAPVRQVEGGPLDYLMLDYLAEVTMSIMQKQRSRDPSSGYARDFVPLMERIFPTCIEKGVRVVTNAGGVNPDGCADALVEAGRSAGVGGKAKVGLVTGDDLMDRLDELMAEGHELRNMETGAPLSDIRDQVQSANAYIGAAPIVRALEKGADVIVTGRSTDTALTYGPLMHEFGWAPDDYDRIAAGVVAGHVNECGAQCTGGNCLIDWWTLPGMTEIGFPIVEASPDGSFVVTKHEGTGGRVSRASVAEQILYEMGDPTEYITPDVVADFTTIRLDEVGPNRVRVHGVKGRHATDFLKVSIAYASGWKATGTLTYSWPDAAAKARAADAHPAGAARSPRARVRRGPDRAGRLGLHARCARRTAARGPSGGAASCGCALVRSPCGRALHAGDRAARPDRPSVRDRLRRRTPARPGDHGLLAGAHPQGGCPAASRRGGEGRMTRIQLVHLAHARSGDKGDTANVGIIAYDAADYPLLVEQLTPERVKAHFGDMVKGDVDRFELPNLHALNFLLHGALGGGGTMSLMNDAQGKVFSTAMLRMEVEVPEAVARKARGRGRVPEGWEPKDGAYV